MAIKKVNAGESIYKTGQKILSLDIIANGNVISAQMPDLVLETGDAIGITDLLKGISSSTYTAQNDLTLITYPYEDTASFTRLLHSNKDLPYLLFSSMLKQLCPELLLTLQSEKLAVSVYPSLSSYYEKYIQLCSDCLLSPKSLPTLEKLAPLNLQDQIEEWLYEYYNAFLQISKEEHKSFLTGRVEICAGLLQKASMDFARARRSRLLCQAYYTACSGLLLNQERADLFDLFTDLNYRLLRNDTVSDELTSTINSLIEDMEQNPCIDQSLLSLRLDQDTRKTLSFTEVPDEDDEVHQTAPDDIPALLKDSAAVILDYAGCSNEINQLFHALLNRYIALSDKSSADDSAIKLRKDLAAVFYEVYISAFQISAMAPETPPVILRMFFLFGYTDERLLDASSSIYLYQLAESYVGDEAHGIYTFYEWLSAIYQGKKSPSKNEFDTDYDSYVHTLRHSNKIDAETEERMKRDCSGKVMYELKNMFPLVNRMAFGEASTYCPVLSEHAILKPLQTSLVTPEQILESLNALRGIDYSAYYRETVYTNTAQAVTKEYIQVEVLPDFILMPTLGTRGVMWQEIEGRKRTTPARMMLPSFCMNDLTALVIRLTGEYRWEMCKRVQGSRWNDVSDHSLTSDYFDYVQFYRKNTALSSDAKEKMRLSLQRAKNSFKESFVRDYMLWIAFEATGAPRLNKVARMILYTYCPFTKEIEEKLSNNPLYTEAIEAYDLQRKRQLHHYELLTQKVNSQKKELPQEILDQITFLNG